MQNLKNLENLENLKKYIYPNGIYSKIRSNSRTIKKQFPEIYEIIEDNYHIKLFMLLNNVNEIPKCKNPNCNNSVNLKSISEGFRKFCSNKCIGQYQQTDVDFSAKIKKTKLCKNILKNRFYPLDIHYDDNKNYIIINNYCKHGNIRLYSNTFFKLFKNNKCLCRECNIEFIKSYIPIDKEIKKLYNDFDNFYNINRFNLREDWLILNYPQEYSIINYFSKNVITTSLAEKIYLFKNNLKEQPKCLNCNKKTHFNHSSMQYTKFCNSPACNKNTSIAELEIYDYLCKLNNTTKHKFYIDGKEYDILVEDKKLLIEFNGLYWHSDEIQEDKKYHYKKWKTAIDNDYQLFTIWEDDWEEKKDIVLSMLKYKLNKIEKLISARKCEIKEVEPYIAKEFLEKNHLQGKCVDSIRVGLFYENKLISLMTFGKRKISGKTQFELLRFANILNTSVVGAASRLFKYFINKYKESNIISYASLDYSTGGLYDILGFNKLNETGINYWWVKSNQRYHRTNFMKWKLIKDGEDPLKTEDEIMRIKGFNKIWNAGNLKYEWKQ
jgi:hypothetical protein